MVVVCDDWGVESVWKTYCFEVFPIQMLYLFIFLSLNICFNPNGKKCRLFCCLIFFLCSLPFMRVQFIHSFIPPLIHFAPFVIFLIIYFEINFFVEISFCI
jgi:hypothetical protein